MAVGAPAAPAAKKKLIKASILGNPYVISSSTSALPVLMTRQSVTRNKLASPLGVVYVPRRKLVNTPEGEVLPGDLRPGDRFKAFVRVSKSQRQELYTRIRLPKIVVYKRNKELSTKELEALLRKTQAQVDALTGRFGEFAQYVLGRFGALDATVAGLDSRLSSLTAQVDGLTGRLTALEAALAAMRLDLQAQVDALTGDLGGVKAQLEGLLARVTDVETAIEGLLARVGDLETAIDDLTSALESLTGRVDLLEDALEILVTEVTNIQTLVDGLDLTALTTVVNDLAAVQQQLLGLVTQVGGIDTLLTTTVSQLGDLDTAFATLRDVTVADLDGTVSGLSSSLTTALADITDLETSLGGLTSDLSSLTGQVTTIDSSLTSLGGRVGTLESLVGGAGSGLVKQVNSLQTSLNALSLEVAGICAVSPLLCL